MTNSKPNAPLGPRPYTAKWWKSEGVLGTAFATQADLKVHIRGIIDGYELNTPLEESAAAFLIDVLRRHHNWVDKEGAGIISIVIRLNPPPGFGPARRGLWLIRGDGSETDISWYAPLHRGGALYEARGVTLAARAEVSDQTRAIYELYRGTPCPICGKPLQNGHVDHIPPLTLARLLENWLAADGITRADIDIVDDGTRRFFVDRTLAARWAEFHRVNARLRLIHPGENLMQAK